MKNRYRKEKSINSKKTTLYDMLKDTCEQCGESIDELVLFPPLEKLKVEFENDHGSCCKCDVWQLFAWGKDWVYYLDDYDGLKSIERVPRNPILEYEDD